MGGVPSNFESLGAVEDPQDEQVGEAFDVGKAGAELREDFEEAFGFVFGAGAFGDLLRVLVGAADVADGLGRKHGCYPVLQESCIEGRIPQGLKPSEVANLIAALKALRHPKATAVQKPVAPKSLCRSNPLRGLTQAWHFVPKISAIRLCYSSFLSGSLGSGFSMGLRGSI